MPLSHFVGHAKSAPVGGGPKLDGCYATQGNCRRVPGRQFSAICEASRWMGCGARMNRLRHLCCCGGLRSMVTRELCGYGITEDLCKEAAGVGGDAV